MSNQYKNALYYAEAELHTKLEQWNIEVNPTERVIVWHGIVKNIPEGTTKVECLRTLRRFIKAAQNIRQETLL